MGRVKIPHSTFEHDRVRVFLPDPILTSQDLSRRSGNPRYEGARSAGVRSRLAGIGGQKSETEASSLAEVFFFESHIRATNAPARRIPILLIMSKNSAR